MSQNPVSARERIYKLLRLELGKDIGYDDFRIEYEDLYNFGLDRESVTEVEFKVFERLFDRIVWYSPLPEEREKIPSYIGEGEMDAAVAEARRDLGLRPGKLQ
ncbi:MAG TPA: hypothetical protein VF789_01095 [Thermoanaerobaculia bacterium]